MRLLSDFWWLSPAEKDECLYVELVNDPLLKDDDAPLQAFSRPCFSLVSEMGRWRANLRNTNVYRSLKVWKDNSKREALTGPFIVDIDNENGCLDDALTVTRKAVKSALSLYGVGPNDVRVFFTGHKGFNIEVRPSSVGITGSPEEQKSKGECRRKEIIKELGPGKSSCGISNIENGKPVWKVERSNTMWSNQVSAKGTLIDVTQDYIRLHDSINAWIEDKETKNRKKVILSLAEIDSLTLEQIIHKSIP